MKRSKTERHSENRTRSRSLQLDSAPERSETLPGKHQRTRPSRWANVAHLSRDKLEFLKRLERWQSGRMRRFAKPLYGLTPVPRVRIPPSPPDFSIQST